MIHDSGYETQIAASVKHDDDMLVLKKAGVDSVFNIYAEAGSGFANHVCESFSGHQPSGEKS